MTQKEAFAAIRAMGLIARKVDREYQIAYHDDPCNARTYYTDDLVDALDTARIMARETSAVAVVLARQEG